MRRKFSEKYGFKDIRESLQIESMDEALKNRLWNSVKKHFMDPMNTNYNGFINSGSDIGFINKLYDEFFKLNIEPTDYKESLISDFKTRYFNLSWNFGLIGGFLAGYIIVLLLVLKVMTF